MEELSEWDLYRTHTRIRLIGLHRLRGFHGLNLAALGTAAVETD